MIIKYTKQEIRELEAIEAKYKKLLDKAERELEKVAPPAIDYDSFYQGVDMDNPQHRKAATDREKKARRERERAASPEYKEARVKYYELEDALIKERNAFFAKAEQGRFDELGGDIQAIYSNAKEQAALLLQAAYDWHQGSISERKPKQYSAAGIVSTAPGAWQLDLAYTRRSIIDGLHLHYNALGDTMSAEGEPLSLELGRYILGLLIESPLVAQETTEEAVHTVYFPGNEGATLSPLEALGIPPELFELTPDFTYGAYAIMPTSKLVQKQTQIAKHNGKEASVNVGGEGEERAEIKATITTDRELPAEAIEIQNVIGEMIQANGNRPLHVTRAQIWRAFACLEDGVTVSEKSQEYIGDMVNLLAEAKGRLDFTQQVEKHKRIKKDKGYDYSQTVLEGPLVMRDETTVTAGGHKTKGFILYRLPMFFLHSHLTNQITRIDRTLLDTTADKITDSQGRKHKVEARQNDIGFILLKRYIARQVEHMKAEKEANKGKYEARRSFESISKAVGLEKPTPKQIRTMRANIELLCIRWKAQEHIKGYTLYTNRGSRAYAGVQIEI